MALALDGSGHANATNVSSIAVTLTTSNADDVICIVVTMNGVESISSISDDAGLTWTERATSVADASHIEFWTAPAPSALTTDEITVTLSGSTTFITVDAFGISGADTTTIFDSNVALPDTQDGSGHVTITTSNADDFLIGAYRFSVANPTEGTGWTKISGANFQLTEYKIVSATQSALDVDIGTGDGSENGGIGDAIIAAAVVGAAPPFQSMSLMGVGR